MARGATLRRTIITIAARLVRPQRRPLLHLPARRALTEQYRKSWADQRLPPAHTKPTTKTAPGPSRKADPRIEA